MVPLIMCNALNINLIVISNRSTGYDVMTVNTGDKPGGEMILVVLMECDKHYDACMQWFDIDMNNHTSFCEPRMPPAYQYLENHPVNAVSALAEKSCTTNTNSPCASVNTLVANGCTTLSNTSFEFQHDVFKSLLPQCGGFLQFLYAFSYVSPSNDDAIVDEKNIGYQGQSFQFRAKYPKNLSCGHLNINSFRNKYTEIEYILTQNLMDVLFGSETKIDSSFTNAQFHINDFKLHRSDRNCHRGGILAYVRSDLLHRRRCDLEDLVCNPIESLVLEMYIRKEKWLFICMYSPNNKYKYIWNEVLDSLLDITRSSEISNIHVLADLNINMLNEIDCKGLNAVIESHGLKNVITEPACHKSKLATLIDVILTSNHRIISGTLNTDVGFSDYHNLVAFSTKLHLPRLAQKVISYRSYKRFDEEIYRRDFSSAPFHVGFIFDDFDDTFWFNQTLLSNYPI